MLLNLRRKVVFPLMELVRSEPISKCFHELNKSQWYTYEQLREIQWKKVKMLVEHCYKNIPFYKSRFEKLDMKPKDFKTFDDFRKLPFLTKDDLRFNKREILFSNFQGAVEHCHSGGTLGKPLNFIRDSKSSAYARASQLRAFHWFGIRREDRQLRVWGIPFDKKQAARERIKDFILNRYRISPFEITEKVVERYYKIIKNFRPKYIYGYPSAIAKICQFLNENRFDGKELNIAYVITAAETLYKHQRQYIKDFLNCNVINEYGCSEVGPIAYECPKGNLHINMENVLVEFIEHDEFSKENAEIILTNLNSFSMPLLRYKIGDTGQLKTRDCSCGRKLDIMSFNAGRVLGTLLRTDGALVSGTVFCYIAFDIIDKFGGIKDFRVMQNQRSKIEVTLSKDDNFTPEIIVLFSSKVRAVLGQDMEIEYIFKDNIPLEKSGKRLFVYSEIVQNGVGTSQ